MIWREPLVRRLRDLAKARVILVVSGSLFARLMIFCLLAVASARLTRHSFEFVAYILAVTSAAQVLLDPQTANLLITRWYSNNVAEVRAGYRSGILLQSMTAVLVLLSPLAIGLASGAHKSELLLGLSLGAVAGSEGLCRYARVTWQAATRFGWYAGIDVILGFGRLATILVLLFCSTMSAFAVANACVAIALLGLLLPAYRALPKANTHLTGRWSLRKLFFDVLPYGASTTCSSLYAQAPAVIIGLRGGLGSAAVYSVAVRLTQPTELVPSSLASTYLPRLVQAGAHERRQILRHMVIVALSVASVGAILLVASSPLVLRLFAVDLGRTQAVLAILAVVLLPKFVNYQLVALAIANGRIVQRLACAVAVAIFSVSTVYILAPRGPVVIACVGLASELLLLSLLVFTGTTTVDDVVPARAS